MRMDGQQKPANLLASWAAWFLGVPVVFSLLVRLIGNKDLRKLRLTYYSFLIF